MAPNVSPLLKNVSLSRRQVGCNGVTQDVLDGNSASAHGRTKLIVEMDWEKYLCGTQGHQSTHVVAEIASFTSWLKLLDMVLDHGQQGTLSLQTFFQKLSRPCYGSTLYLCFDIKSLEEHYFHHFKLSPLIQTFGSAPQLSFINWLTETRMCSELPSTFCE